MGAWMTYSRDVAEPTQHLQTHGTDVNKTLGAERFAANLKNSLVVVVAGARHGIYDGRHQGETCGTFEPE